MKQTDPHFKLRLPPELKAQIEEAAKMAGRSMSAEIVNQLEASYRAIDQSVKFADRIDFMMKNFEDQSAIMRVSLATANAAILYLTSHMLEQNIEIPLMDREYLQRLRNSVAHGQNYDAMKADLAVFQKTLKRTKTEVLPAIERVFEAYGLQNPATNKLLEERDAQLAAPDTEHRGSARTKPRPSQRKPGASS